ncbi:MAG: twin-arginine translocase TatA/TatE family subunit [Bdellovibrionota bacterium]
MIMPGGMELLIIAGVIVLLFGAKKLPGLGGAIGESIKNFKAGIKDGEKDLIEGKDKESSTTSSDKSSNE